MREAAPVMARRGRGGSGVTLAELLAVLGVAGVLAGLLLLWGSPAAFSQGEDVARPARCRSRMQMMYQGLRMYLNNYEEYFPLAWHVGGRQAAQDLSNVAYHRFLIYESCDNAFRRTVKADDVERHKGDRQAAAQEKLKQTFQFWKCPASGWTDDHFAPEIAFRWPEKPNEPFDKHSQYSALVKDVASTERPLLADVNASFPNPKASDPADPGHEKEMKSGFSVVRESGLDVFVGVGASLRNERDPMTGRLDFRHGSEGGPLALRAFLANVLFLDGHVESVSSRNAARVLRIHERWNNVVPPRSE